MHGNTGKFRRTDSRGQLPLLLGTNNESVCSKHGIPMKMLTEHRTKGGKVRVRYRCPHCESDRHLDLEGLISRLQAKDWPRNLGSRQRELLPHSLVEEFDEVMAQRRAKRLKEKSRKRNFQARLRRFGISEETHQRMAQEQKGCCAICGIQVGDLMALHIDHCHERGHVRGLLCSGCNTGLGHFRDNVLALEQAARYLRERSVA